MDKPKVVDYRKAAALLKHASDPADGRDALIRKLLNAQDLTLIDRLPGGERPAADLLATGSAGNPGGATGRPEGGP
jgi:hypothetical protein